MASVQRVVRCPNCGEVTFNVTTYTDGERRTFCYHCGYVHDLRLVEEDHPEKGHKEVIIGGYGVVTVSTGSCVASRSVTKGEIPELTEDVIFAFAILDGKLTILKQPEV